MRGPKDNQSSSVCISDGYKSNFENLVKIGFALISIHASGDLTSFRIWFTFEMHDLIM